MIGNMRNTPLNARARFMDHSIIKRFAAAAGETKMSPFLVLVALDRRA